MELFSFVHLDIYGTVKDFQPQLLICFGTCYFLFQPDTAAVMDILLHRMKTLCGDDTREMVTEGPVMTNEKRKGAE